MTQIEIYVIKTEILGNKAQNEELEKLRDEITLKIGGITILPIIRGEWFEEGTKFVDIGEIWRFLATDEQTVDYSWLHGKIDAIKAVTGQISQLYTVNTNCKSYFR